MTFFNRHVCHLLPGRMFDPTTIDYNNPLIYKSILNLQMNCPPKMDN